MWRPITASYGRKVIVDIGLFEHHMVVTCRLSSATRDLQRLGVKIEAMHASMRAYEARGNQRDLANAASQFKDMHSRRNSGATKKTVGEGIEERGLQCEPAPFVIGVAHEIGRRLV
jgi:hypothetical protein